MKFRDGYWELKSGVRRFGLFDVIDICADETSIAIVTTCAPAPGRADRVGCALLTTVLSSPAPDIIHVKRFHHKGAKKKFPVPELSPDKKITALEDEKTIQLCAGKLSCAAGKHTFSAAFYYGEKYLTSIDARNSGYFTLCGETGLDALEKPAPRSFMAEYLGLSAGEKVYGLGERFAAFVKNGQNIDMWNADGGTSSEQSYKNIPFYITSRGYGVYVASMARVSFEIASEVVSAAQFSLAGEEIDYYIIAGDTLKNVLRNYTFLTGRPALPPAWSFGLWLTTSFVTDYDEQTVNSFVDGMKERDIPLHIFHFDCFWMRECQWMDFNWDAAQFNDPAMMLARLKTRGLKICVWINPYIAQKSPLFDEAARRNFLVRRTDGSVWQWDFWQSGMGIVDFTNPEAANWYAAHLEKLIDMGVDCFKTDFGERIPSADIVWYSGADAECMHNYYTLLYNKTVFTALENARKEERAVVFARSAAAGSQRFPLHWGGDCSASYASMAETLRGGLSLGLCGFGFWSHDISGFENTASADLFKRWTAFGLLSSHSRLHGNKSYRVPWNFDDEASDVLRFWTKLKCRLMPYLFAQAVAAHNDGIPILRAMILEYPDDAACAYLDMQYMLGCTLLAAPVFNENGVVDFYLPAGGRWTNIISGCALEGGTWRRETHGYFSLPLFAAPHSIIAFGAEDARPDYDFAYNVCFEVFELQNHHSAHTTVYDINGKPACELFVQREDGLISVTKSGEKKPWKILFHGITDAKIFRADTDVNAHTTPRGFCVDCGENVTEIKMNL